MSNNINCSSGWMIHKKKYEDKNLGDSSVGSVSSLSATALSKRSENGDGAGAVSTGFSGIISLTSLKGANN